MCCVKGVNEMSTINVNLDELLNRASELTELAKRAERILETPFETDTFFDILENAIEKAGAKTASYTGKMLTKLERARSIDEAVLLFLPVLLEVGRETIGGMAEKAEREKAREEAKKALKAIYEELVSKQAMIDLAQREIISRMRDEVRALDADIEAYGKKAKQLLAEVAALKEKLQLVQDIGEFRKKVEV